MWGVEFLQFVVLMFHQDVLYGLTPPNTGAEHCSYSKCGKGTADGSQHWFSCLELRCDLRNKKQSQELIPYNFV